jgi:hypothetical protein
VHTAWQPAYWHGSLPAVLPAAPSAAHCQASITCGIQLKAVQMV